MKFNKRLRELRKLRGVTAREVSEETGVSASYLGNLEAGRVITASDDVIIKLASYYGVNADELLCEAGRVPFDIVRLLMKQPELCHRIRQLAEA